MSNTFNDKLDEILKNLRNEAYEQAGLADATVKETKQAIRDLVLSEIQNAKPKNSWIGGSDLYHGFHEGVKDYEINLNKILKGE